MTSDPSAVYAITGNARTSGGAAAGVAVAVFDLDRGRLPTLLAETTTDTDGRFRLTFAQAAAGGRGEGDVEALIVIGSVGATRHRLPSPISPGDLDVGELTAPESPTTETQAPGDPDTDVGQGGQSAGDPSGAIAAPADRDPSSKPGDNRGHGRKSRDLLVPRSPFYEGAFGRLFRKLPPWVPPGKTDAEKEAAIRAISATMFEGPDQGWSAPADNPAIPAAYTYFGQFVDHDVTFDPTSSLTKLNDPDRLQNFRTPKFDLDNLYGEGPDDEPFLYDKTRTGAFLMGPGKSPGEVDLLRNPQGVAIIGDPRNDENIIVSQIQMAFLKLHNAVLDRVLSSGEHQGRDAFHQAQNLVRWHYQWVVLFDFLPRICGQAIVDAVIAQRPGGVGYDIDLQYYRPKQTSYMPVEFSAAAYRLGHSMIRQAYNLNKIVTDRPIFTDAANPGELDDLRGFRPLPGFWTVDWRHFVDLDPAQPVQPSRRLDAKLSKALEKLPGGESLAALNLLRGFRLALPSGQSVAKAMGQTPLDNGELGLDPELAGPEAPLWFYILKEAELLGGGAHLGPVGGRIVAEVFVGLAKNDPNAFLNVDPAWTPTTAFQGRPLVPFDGPFQLRHLFVLAGVDKDPFP
ncbi:heme peroxidase family protein [Phenylobacterium sp. LH3H17]|uniref:peroxidase family protein n=1 Tax=Phenylobacterium sp. LH3H17 TaxID=2903901 RepID=UPI0020C9F98D|nr:heme peroxidase family protein [Phenylobacterium sp. LH3H17]UTP39780.1 heme peroxidase family protein [Phenylobacterium sp. LH3H17]